MSRGPVAVRAESERLRQESAGLIRSAKAACERAQLLFRTIETRFRTSRLIRPAAIPAGGEADGPARSEGRIPGEVEHVVCAVCRQRIRPGDGRFRLDGCREYHPACFGARRRGGAPRASDPSALNT